MEILFFAGDCLDGNFHERRELLEVRLLDVVLCVGVALDDLKRLVLGHCGESPLCWRGRGLGAVLFLQGRLVLLFDPGIEVCDAEEDAGADAHVGNGAVTGFPVDVGF